MSKIDRIDYDDIIPSDLEYDVISTTEKVKPIVIDYEVLYDDGRTTIIKF